MKLSIAKADTPALQPGDYQAKTGEIKDLGNGKAEWPFEVKHGNTTVTVKKAYKDVTKIRSELMRDAETVNGEPFREGAEVDLITLTEKPCRVVIVHKRGSGGKLTAVVNSVLRANEHRVLSAKEVATQTS
jgi:hypothetical protein